jgi:hypothetical protein
LDWAADGASGKGFAGVTVSCEPTGHRWRVFGQLAEHRSMRFVCVQPTQTFHARRAEDLTLDKGYSSADECDDPARPLISVRRSASNIWSVPRPSSVPA